MPEKLLQLLDRIGKEALIELRRRGAQINPFLLGRHHHYLDTALRRVVAHQIPIAAAEGALRMAYWDQMQEFLRGSPLPQVVPLEWSGPLKDVVNVLVVGTSDEVPGGLLVRPDSVVDDLRRILHWTMLRLRVDLICFPRLPVVDVPASTANLLRSLAKEYNTVIQIGWYAAAGNAGDHVVLYVPTLNDRDSLVQRKLFADRFLSENANDLALRQLAIAPTQAGNLSILVGDDVEHESVRDLVCRQNREADGIDIILNIATGTEFESPTALSRLCTDADAYGLWIQRGARPILCAPGAPDRLGTPTGTGTEPLPGLNLTTFAIHLAPLRRMRRTRAAQDASPGRTGPRVPPPAWQVAPTLAAPVEALRRDVAAPGRTDKPTPSRPSSTSDDSSLMSELRAYLEQNSGALASLGASVTALTDSSRTSGASAESVARAVSAVAEQMGRLQANRRDPGSDGHDEIKTLIDLTNSLRAELVAARALFERDASGERLAKLDDSVRTLPGAIGAAITRNQVVAPAPHTSEQKEPTNETALLTELKRIDQTLGQLTGLMAASESRDSAEVNKVIEGLGSH